MGIVIALVVAAGIAYAVYRWIKWEPYQERHCATCRKVTRWHPKKGCRDCQWADQQL